MPNRDATSRRGVEAELYPKSSGENVLNENQSPAGAGFQWKRSADRTINAMSMKRGYGIDIYSGVKQIDHDITLTDEVNYMSVGTFTIPEGVTVTLEGEWVIV